MKPFTLLLFITASTVVYAQSQKKQHRLLLAELASEQQKQEDALALFKKSKAGLDSVKFIANDKMWSLKGGEKSLLDWFFRYSGLLQQLKELEVVLPPLISHFKSDEVPVEREFVEPIKSILNTVFVFEKVSNKTDLGDLSRKEQNKVLQRKLDEYERYALSNSIRLGEVKKSEERIKAFLPRMDSLQKVYERITNEMTSDCWKMHDKLKQLEAEFRKKGPGGYTEPYFRIFPEVFPGFVPPMVDKLSVKTTPVADLMPENLPQLVIDNRDPDVFEWTEEIPTFVGGKEELDKFIAKNLRYPESVEQGIIFGKVVVKFIVSEKGEISAVEVLKGIPACPECGEEAIRLIESTPNWNPGRQDNKAVKCYVRLPINFQL